jgi:hypothetical protein
MTGNEEIMSIAPIGASVCIPGLVLPLTLAQKGERAIRHSLRVVEANAFHYPLARYLTF